MSEEDDLEDVLAAATVANALRDEDFEAFADLADVLDASGAKGRQPTLCSG